MPHLPTEVLELEVRLIGVDPPIWRRLKLPTHHSLADLHLMLQVLMGWDNKHLYEFSYGDRRFEAPDVEAHGEDVTGVRLVDLKLQHGSSLRYVYDFGDEWTLAIIVVDNEFGAAESPICTAGERAGPPEDAGGAWRYRDLLQALANPQAHPDMGELLAWLPEDFDPEQFDRAAVNTLLQRWVGRAI